MPQLDPRMGEFYRYYLGGTVQVISLCGHTETAERMVVYQELFGSFDCYATPFVRFVGEVDKAKHLSCTDRFRYTLIERPLESREKAASIAEEPPLAQGEPDKDDDTITPLMLSFLDERDFEKKEEILSEMKNNPQLNDAVIDNLAAALDVVIDEGPLDRRFTQLQFCVRTRARFENTRLR